MSLYGFAAFCGVYLLAVATPGPGVAAVLSRSLTHGMRGAPAFIAGFLIGDLIWVHCRRTTAQLAVQLKYTSSLQSMDHSDVRRSFWANTVTSFPVSVLMR
jgi:threonine/homoserine/homoserine lactone efflux protein